MRITYSTLKGLTPSQLNALTTITGAVAEGFGKEAEIRALLNHSNSDAVVEAYKQVAGKKDDTWPVSEPTHSPKKDPEPKARGSVDNIIELVVDEKIAEAKPGIKSEIKDELKEEFKPRIEKVVIREHGGEESTKKVEGVMPKEFDHILRLASLRLNIFLTGPTGCGKTFVAKKVAEALDLEFSSVSVTIGMSKSDLLGYLLPIEAGGNFSYVPAPFVTAFESGGVFLLDEIDNGDPNTLGIVNQALANGEFYLPQRIGSNRVERHEDFICIAAANTFGTGADAMYVGRSQLDAATLDRFASGMVQMDYSDEVEEAIVDGEVLKWGRELRSKIERLKLQRVVSTRLLIELSKLKEVYGYKESDFVNIFSVKLPDEEYQRLFGEKNSYTTNIPF